MALLVVMMRKKESFRTEQADERKMLKLKARAKFQELLA